MVIAPVPIRLAALRHAAGRAAVRFLLGVALTASILLAWQPVRATISYITGSTATANGTTMTLAPPAGVAVGDLLLALVSSRGAGDLSATGWTPALAPVVDGSNIRLTVLYRFRAAGDSTSYDFSLSNGDRMAGVMLAFRGVSAANPIAAAQGSVGAASETSVTAGGVDVPVPNAMLIAAFAQDDGNGSLSTPVGMSPGLGVGTKAGPNGTSMTSAFAPLTSAGHTGSRTSTSDRNARGVAALVTLRPSPMSISGTIFDDVTYPGGAGRDRATALANGGAGRGGARVELYDQVGSFVTATTSASDGSYQFNPLSAGIYTVRVVNGTVGGRTGFNASTMIPVQTFRTDAGSGTAIAVVNRVGGEDPRVNDAGNGSTTLAALSVAGSTAAQSISTVDVRNGNVTGVDFGFNFSTVVNARDTTTARQQGTLRQVLTNLAGLTATGVSFTDLSGRAFSNTNVTIFMIPDGSSRAGLNPSFNLFTASGCARPVARIAAVAGFSNGSARMDAQTHPSFDATNPLPLIELDGSSAGTGAVGVTAAGTAGLSGFIINRFASHGVSSSGTGVRVEGAWVGLHCSGTAAAANGGSGVVFNAGGNHQVGMRTAQNARYRMVISGNVQHGIFASNVNAVIRGNYIGTSWDGTAAVPNGGDGINWTGQVNAGGSSGGLLQVISGNAGWGIRVTNANGAGGAGITEQIIGRNVANNAGIPNGSGGIWINNSTTSTTYPVARNTIASNLGDGLRVTVSGANPTPVQVRSNSFFDNAGLGINLVDAADLPSGVTPNRGALAASGTPNRLMSHAVITSASLSGTVLTVSGYVGSQPGLAAFAYSRVEVFVAADDPSGYGEGRGFVGVLTADASGNFSGIPNATGAQVPVVAPVAGDRLTATAEQCSAPSTCSGLASEFGPLFQLQSAEGAGLGSFNAFETSTSANAVNGVVRTKVAGQPFIVDLAALNPARSGYAPGALNNVRVELLDASDDSGALDATTQCRSSWTVASTLTSSFAFAHDDNGRKSFTATVAGAYRQVRLRVSWPASSPTKSGCSTDAFAIRPAAFTSVQASDGNAQSAGTARLLDNANATSGVVHQAGRPFTLRAVAVDANGNLVAGYSGTPLATAACLQPTGCSAGSLTGTLAASGGAVAGTLAYAEAGVIALSLEDTTFALVDAADGSTLAERAARTAAPITVGRFVPDRYAVTLNTPDFAAGCSAANLTFVGQPFTFGTQPTAVATPVGADGQPLANARPRFTAAMVTVEVTATGAPTALQGALGTISVSNAATSFISVGTSSFSFLRTATPSASYTPALTLRVRVDDSTEDNGGAPLTLSGEGTTAVGFGAGHLVHYGRLALRPAYGDARQDLVLPLELQSFNGNGWVPLTAAAACIGVTPPQFAYMGARGSLATNGAFNCASSVASLTPGGGRWAVRLPRPSLASGVAEGAMNVHVNTLASANGQVCSSGSPIAATSTLASPWLAQPDGSNPTARVQWGRSRGDFVQVRERFN
jgi:hypothetical protein